MKQLFKLFATAAALVATVSGVQAQDAAWPSKPITLVVPFAPGGITDNTARLLARKMGERLGQPVVVDNRPGAGGSLGVDSASRQPGDGYTLIFGTSGTHAANLALYKTVRYDPIKDFVPIHGVLESSLILVVNANKPFKTVAELVSFGKANPGKLNYASAGPGTGTHLTATLFEVAAGIDMTHVPYKGSNPALTDLIGGNVDLMFDYPVTMLPQVQAGKLRALAVTSPQRLTITPDVPTVVEAGYPGALSSAWTALFAPAKTPPVIAKRLSDAAASALADPEMQEAIKKFGGVPMTDMRDAKLGAFVQSEMVRWRDVVKRSGATLD